MVNEDSPVKDFYPVDFETDLNGKQMEWEAVVLIPFISEERLLNAMKPCSAYLSEEVRERGKRKEMEQKCTFIAFVIFFTVCVFCVCMH